MKESISDLNADMDIGKSIQRESLGMTTDEAYDEIQAYRELFSGAKKIGRSRVENMRKAAQVYREAMESGNRDNDPDIQQIIEEILKKTVETKANI